MIALKVFSCPHHLLLPWLCSPHGFCKHSREQYEKLSMMHKNMQKLYESLGNFFAFDPHSVSMEDFFGDLANFRALFMVSSLSSHTEKPRFSPFTRAHRHKQQPQPTPTLFYTYIRLLIHTWFHRAAGVCVTLRGRRSGTGGITCLRITALQSQPSLTPARLARGDFPEANAASQSAAWQKVFLLLEFTASPHQFAQHWHAWTAHLLCEFLHMSSKK